MGNDGFIYAFRNSDGQILQVNVETAAAVFVGTAVPDAVNDGMSCSIAPPPLEYCGNGVDDNGDGIVDEDDDTPD